MKVEIIHRKDIGNGYVKLFVRVKTNHSISVPLKEHYTAKTETLRFHFRTHYFSIVSLQKAGLMEISSMTPYYRHSGRYYILCMPHVMTSGGVCFGDAKLKTFKEEQEFVEYYVNTFWSVPFDPNHLYNVQGTGKRYCCESCDGPYDKFVERSKEDGPISIFKKAMVKSKTIKGFHAYMQEKSRLNKKGFALNEITGGT